ncbi:uncharacterized protein PITG_16553 [Phytophthora infestans T30-4]|uniref:CBM1 domain-containing protein n=1 Tax=Phytophthora infestans (strain T30-4) TaxID=403677 RepID=D0NTX3_PHYIT|nr:uncharacterized protein PITG_16553 [Phytophthora infestans T30-4]EEY65085.1 conserved hypothetical protein [Phytophthora infestans T30-4]|eukprot:XP_002897573.1 conserved hypothetical protein [Phytophthora infestans T30-4]
MCSAARRRKPRGEPAPPALPAPPEPVAVTPAVSVSSTLTTTRIRQKIPQTDESCTITNESQCDGQNWTGSTCCADPAYECRKSDDGQNVKRCQKVAHADSEDSNSDDDYSHSDDGSYIEGDVEYSSYVDDWEDCTSIDVGCSNPTSYCVLHSLHYAQCKPETLPQGELCGQNDGTNVWWYPFCATGESCQPKGTDFRCAKNKKRHHHHRRA